MISIALTLVNCLPYRLRVTFGGLLQQEMTGQRR